ncbi:MAG: nuclear transport factor 2 family protein [Flammeovirgaceae bacterium]|jgi:tetratricopeptide (TPR) repeat protein|nr:nuclear transport factor 2 family protein [Flammeovirgaceae bacterium]|tara:strand:- start:593 stop:1723 length:1131 start_codon:yes stop_codon:yes gene_type:complete
MKRILFLGLLLTTYTSNGQWISKMSCSKKASIIMDEAIESAFNLEPLIALGQAKAALMVDENCGCSQLLIAAISSPNLTWGSKQEKLSTIVYDDLSGEEQAWYDILKANKANLDSAIKKSLETYPLSPMFNYLTVGGNIDSNIDFTNLYTNYGAMAFNDISYAHMAGDFGEVNYSKAMENAQKSINLHDGPNIFDSIGEHEFLRGNYDKALAAQLKAIDYAAIASPYMDKANKYRRYVNKDKIVSQLIDDQIKFHEAIIAGNEAKASEYMQWDVPVIFGDSNLDPFYVFENKSLNALSEVKWKAMELYDFEVHFSPDMRTALLTFYARGLYVVNNGPEIAYGTRASSVWINTNNAWKVMHENWAPKKGNEGIPVSN